LSQEDLGGSLTVIGVIIRAEVEPDQRRELIQMCKSWLVSSQVPKACSERRVYEDVISPTCLLLVEEWSNKEAMHSYLSSEPFRALIGAVKVLGNLVDLRVFETEVIEGGTVPNTSQTKQQKGA
jgi:quinol monooxygenase YgiN